MNVWRPSRKLQQQLREKMVVVQNMVVGRAARNS